MKLFRSWFNFVANLVPDRNEDRRFAAILFLATWFSSFLLIVLVGFRQLGYDVFSVWPPQWHSNSDNFRSLGNPRTQVALLVFLLSCAMAWRAARDEPEQRRPWSNLKRALVGFPIYMGLIFLVPLSVSPFGLGLALMMHTLAIFYFWRTDKW